MAEPPATPRRAYEALDVNASIQAHENRITTEEAHDSDGVYIKSIVFGGLDGVLTCFAVIAGAAGGQMSPLSTLVIGFSSLLADALAMGIGEYLSSKAELERTLLERRRESWEMSNNPSGEVEEMIEIFRQKGMEPADAALVITTMAKYHNFFVDIMMVHELGMQVPESEEEARKEAVISGLAMFCSFCFFGSLPLFGYLALPTLCPDASADERFAATCAVTFAVLFFMGALKARFSTRGWLATSAESTLLGGICALAAYLSGQWIAHIGEKWT